MNKEKKMIESRHYMTQLLHTVERMKEKTLDFQEDLQALSSQKEYDEVLSHYENLIQAIKAKLKKFPIGYRYEGKYFMKVPYTMPPQFEECTGFLYMPEHLVSWQREKKLGVIEDYRHYRSIYKEPFGELLTKKDAKPVYRED